MDDLARIGTLSPFTCPECHGSLWETAGAPPLRFRCHTGHGFTARSLSNLQGQMAEEALWAAVRALHEKESLLKQFEKRAREDKRVQTADEHAVAAERVRRHAEVLRKMATG